MWFRNLRLYRFTESLALDPEQIAERLAALPFKPCGRLEPESFGFAPIHGDGLTHVTDGRVMVRARKEEKIVPGGVVKRMVEERARALEEREGRPVRRKEKESIKEELMMELLPRALTRQNDTWAYLDLRDNWLVVDAGSGKKADELLSLLRKCLERLPVRPVAVNDSPSAVMTGWIAKGDHPPDVALGDECELRDVLEEGGVVRVRKQELETDEVRGHLAVGKRVTKLAIEWDGRVACVLDEEPTVRRLRFTEVVEEALNDLDLADEAAAFDADFAIMGGELARFLPRLLALFGGEPQAEAAGAAGAERKAAEPPREGAPAAQEQGATEEVDCPWD